MSKKNKTSGIQTIAVRIALLGWSVALLALGIFVMVTIPWQKKVFTDNLASKANGLAVALHDVAAGAALNEDYASVVSAAQTLVEGDPGLNYVVAVRNDGFAIVVAQNFWRMETLSSSHWLKPRRETSWEIGTCPLFHKKTFHFAQPFDYSGVQWGWIHVGLSLERYDQNVATLYRNTGLAGLACIAISLLTALVYARQMVRPISRLQSIVRQIAQGDLSVRADMKRNDELGKLAASVNTMAESLLQRNRILESVRFAAYHFLQEQRWEETIVSVLENICNAADISRAIVYTTEDRAGRIYASKAYEWDAPGIPPELEDPDYTALHFDGRGISHWAATLADNQILICSIGLCNDAEKKILKYQGVQSLIATPVMVENRWWGAILLQDCQRERSWTSADKSSVRALSDMLGATIARQRFQGQLQEAKAGLEEQVTIRTRELQDQVQAKENALSDLASAQSSLVEMSRAAGMAEVATGVLHNVGNVLNSVNVSATLITDMLKESRAGNVSKIARMLDLPADDLTEFLTRDRKGKQIPAYLVSLGQALSLEHDSLLNEARSLAGRIEHIKEIVAMQQNYGRVSGVNESILPAQLMDDALMLNEKGLARHHIRINKEYETTPSVSVDKHKVLQILLNFIHNAKYACVDSDRQDKTITLKICREKGHLVRMSVIDNGIGIHKDNLTRIFQHGFTTRKSGHGFGLHSGALAAQELGGRLMVESEGPGKGAAFTLELPEGTGKVVK